MEYITEQNKPFLFTIKVFKILCYYPKSLKKTDVIMSKIAVRSICSIWIAFVLSCFIHLVVAVKDHTGENISEDLSVGLSGVGVATILIRFHLNTNQWTRFFIRLTDLHQFGKPTKWNETVKQFKYVPILLIGYGIGGVVLYTITSKLDSSCLEDRNKRFTCKTITPLWTPFNLSDDTEQIIFVIGLCTTLYSLCTMILIHWLVFESSEMIICHIDYLKENILDIFNASNEDLRMKKQKYCFEYHGHIISLGKDLSYLVKNTHGHMSVGAAVELGCILYQVSNRYKVMGMILYLFGTITTIFILCHAGQRITDASLSIADIFYDLKWYKGSPKLNKMFMFSIARSQKPLTLEALPVGTFGYALFTMIMNTSFSYLTLLQQQTTDITNH